MTPRVITMETYNVFLHLFFSKYGINVIIHHSLPAAFTSTCQLICHIPGGYSGHFGSKHGVNTAVLYQMGQPSLWDTSMTSQEQDGDIICVLPVFFFACFLCWSSLNRLAFSGVLSREAKECFLWIRKCHKGLHGDQGV